MPSTYKGFTLPSDGDPENAASVNGVFQPIIDVITGTSQLYTIGAAQPTSTVAAYLWEQDDTAYNDLISSGYPLLLASITGCQVGDVIEAHFDGSMSINVSAVNGGLVRLEYSESGATSTSPLTGAATTLTPNGTGVVAPFGLCGIHTVTVAGAVEIYVNGLVGILSSSGGVNYHLASGNLVYKVWRTG